MIVALIVSFLAVLFCLFDRKHERRRFGGLELGFLLLTIYLCVRYDYGNDYLGYLDDFYKYNSYNIKLTDFEQLSELQSRGDYGWVIINRLCEPIGFFGMIMLLTILFMGQIYYYIKKYVDPKWYWFSVFLFAFQPLLMVVGVAGMIRQWTVVFIFLCCIDLIRRRKLLLYMAIILVATTIHKTAYILFPVYFITYLNFNKNSAFVTYMIMVFAAFVIFPFVGYELFMPLFENEQLSTYGEMVGRGGASGFGISSIITIGMPLLCIAQVRRQSESDKLLFALLSLSILLVPLISINALIGRMVVYFSVFSIVVYPLALDTLKQKGWSSYCNLIIFMIIVYYSYIFISHFTDKVWISHAYYYHTIFSYPWQ